MTFLHTGRLSLDHRHARPSFPPTPESDSGENEGPSYFEESSGSVSPVQNSAPGPGTGSKVQITSLAAWSRYFHPATGLLCANSDRGTTAGEAVRHLVIDARYILAEDEYERPSTKTVAARPENRIVLPNVWKLTLRGAEFAELSDGRAKALADVISSCGKEQDGSMREGAGVVEVEWLHVEPSLAQEDEATKYAATFATNLVHDFIVQAGACNWGESGHGDAVNEDEQEAEKWRYQRVVTPLQKGLKRLALQGGFVLPNPASCASSEAEQSGFNPCYSLQPQFRFAFEDWVRPGGLDVLAWSFKGNYTSNSALSILRHLFGYVAGQVTSSRAPYRALVLDHLSEEVIDGLRTVGKTTMARAGLSGDIWADLALKTWLVDTTFVMHDGGADRLWSDISDDGSANEEENAARERQFRRLKAEMVAVQEVERMRPQPPFLCQTMAKHKPMSLTLAQPMGGLIRSTIPSSAKTGRRNDCDSQNLAQSPLSPPLSRAASNDSRSKASSGETSPTVDSLGLNGPPTGSTQTSVDGGDAGQRMPKA